MRLIWSGVKACELRDVLVQMGSRPNPVLTALNIRPRIVTSNSKPDECLDPQESERAIGLIRLIGYVQTLAEEFGRPDGFDAAKWLGRWLHGYVPALAIAPIDYLATQTGQALLSEHLRRTHAGTGF